MKLENPGGPTWRFASLLLKDPSPLPSVVERAAAPDCRWTSRGGNQQVPTDLRGSSSQGQHQQSCLGQHQLRVWPSAELLHV